MPVELLLHLDRQTAHCAVIDLGGQGQRLELAAALDLLTLPLDVAFIFCLDLDLLGDQRVDGRLLPQARVGHIRSAQNLKKRLLLLKACAHIRRLQALLLTDNGVALSIERIPTGIVDESELATRLGKSQVGIVLAQHQAILGTARGHAIRLRNAARDEIIHQHPEVCLVAFRPPRLTALHSKRSVDARKKPLGCGLFIDRKSTRLNSSHLVISYAVFCLKKKNKKYIIGFMQCVSLYQVASILTHKRAIKR